MEPQVVQLELVRSMPEAGLLEPVEEAGRTGQDYPSLRSVLPSLLHLAFPFDQAYPSVQASDRPFPSIFAFPSDLVSPFVAIQAILACPSAALASDLA